MHESHPSFGAEEGVGVGLDDGDSLLGTIVGAFDGIADSTKLGLMVGEN